MRKILFTLLVVISLSFGLVHAVQAQEGGGVEGNGGDPNYVFTPAELAQIAAKDRMARNHLKEVSIFGASSKYLNVGPAETYREPNTEKYVNYCGPSATQVAIRARRSAAQVPSLDTVATGEYFNKDYGVQIFNIRPYINKVLGTTWYVYAASKDKTQFRSWARLDVDLNYSMITGLKTGGMKGWSFSTNHIVAINGYQVDAANNMSIAYVDTAPEMAGHRYANGGSYFNLASLYNFYKWVSLNNLQVW